jgi:hypothetical protein
VKDRLSISTHSGKLGGIPSINTSPYRNEYCSVMSAVPGTVCSVCYARRLTWFRKALETICVDNGDLLRVYPMAARVPWFAERYVRLHSFGELINVAHLLNFYDIARGNPEVTFALWTKRKELVKRGGTPPDNVVLIYSVTQLDPPKRLLRVPRGFHHTYAVFTTGPDCGARCLDCLRCYTRESPGVIRQRMHR